MVVLVIPMICLYFFIWLFGTETFEDMMSLKQRILISTLYALGSSIVCAVLGFFAVRHWITILPPSLAILSVPVILLLCLSGIFLTVRSLAFQKNIMAEWLQRHPRGKEVLDEFARQAEPL